MCVCACKILIRQTTKIYIILDRTQTLLRNSSHASSVLFTNRPIIACSAVFRVSVWFRERMNTWIDKRLGVCYWLSLLPESRFLTSNGQEYECYSLNDASKPFLCLLINAERIETQMSCSHYWFLTTRAEKHIWNIIYLHFQMSVICLPSNRLYFLGKKKNFLS